MGLARHDLTPLPERRKPLIQEDQPAWDRVLMSGMVVPFSGWLVRMGLDAVRFDGSAAPCWFRGLGGVGVATGLRIVDGPAFIGPSSLAP